MLSHNDCVDQWIIDGCGHSDVENPVAHGYRKGPCDRDPFATAFCVKVDVIDYQMGVAAKFWGEVDKLAQFGYPDEPAKIAKLLADRDAK